MDELERRISQLRNDLIEWEKTPLIGADKTTYNRLKQQLHYYEAKLNYKRPKILNDNLVYSSSVMLVRKKVRLIFD